MSLAQLALLRIQHLRAVIDSLRGSDFPYSDSSAALEHLAADFLLLEGNVREAAQGEGRDRDSLVEVCQNALTRVSDGLRLTGFILRSTNVRNAFELQRPLYRLARQLLHNVGPSDGQPVRLLISSEWRYAHHLLSRPHGLPGFLLMGFPASESDNALLIPIAGHELGHALYNRRAFSEELEGWLDDALINTAREMERDLHAHCPALSDSLDRSVLESEPLDLTRLRAQQQLAETYADLVGVYVFGHSFLRAFAYWLAPGRRHHPLSSHPRPTLRVSRLRRAAEAFGVTAYDALADLFIDDRDPREPPANVALGRLVETAVEAVFERAIAHVKHVISSVGVAPPNEDQVRQAALRYAEMLPAGPTTSLPEVVDAAWRANDDPGLWRTIPKARERREQVLSDLVLKSIELLDYYHVESMVGAAPSDAQRR